MSSTTMVMQGVFNRATVPGEVPATERGVWNKVHAASQRLFPPLWGQFLPGLHRDDARLYAAGIALTRELYLAEGASLTRRDRELVALAVSVDTGSPIGIRQHSRLLGVLGQRQVADLVQRRAVLELEDRRVRGLVKTALERAWADRFEPDERLDIATTLFATHYLDRVVGVLGPRTGFAQRVLFWPPSFMMARMLGLTRTWRPGWSLSYLWVVGDPAQSVEARDGEAINTWIHAHAIDAPLETRELTARFVVGAITQVASELFDPEVLAAIRNHLAQWRGEAIPLTGTWTKAATNAIADERNRRLAEFGLLVARCPERVSPAGLLAACDGSARRRLALVTFASCAAALRIVELLTNQPRGRR